MWPRAWWWCQAIVAGLVRMCCVATVVYVVLALVWSAGDRPPEYVPPQHVNEELIRWPIRRRSFERNGREPGR